jgi:transcriptional regulator with XRE-family HTH domain
MTEKSKQIWQKLAASKKYREQFVSAQVKRGIPFQIRALMKKKGLSQEKLAKQAQLTQGVISRAADPNNGNLTLNTIIRIAAGFDVAFIGMFVAFSDLVKWYSDLSESSGEILSFNEENILAPPPARGPVPLGSPLHTFHSERRGSAMDAMNVETVQQEA